MKEANSKESRKIVQYSMGAAALLLGVAVIFYLRRMENMQRALFLQTSALLPTEGDLQQMIEKEVAHGESFATG